MKASDADLAVKFNALMDLLKWFREHAVKIHVSPTAEGWSLKFSVPEKTATEPAVPPAEEHYRNHGPDQINGG